MATEITIRPRIKMLKTHTSDPVFGEGESYDPATDMPRRQHVPVKPLGTLAPYDPSVREQLAGTIANSLGSLASDSGRGAYDFGRRMVDLSEFIPPVGAFIEAADAEHASRRNDPAAVGGDLALAGLNLLGGGASREARFPWGEGEFKPYTYVDPLAPLPKAPAHVQGPVPAVVQAAEDYARKRGIDLMRQPSYATADPRRGRFIANAYEQMQHAPEDAKVAASYRALADETLAQFHALQDAGIKIDFMKPGEPDPYPGGPREALADLRANKHLSVFPTEQGFGSLNAITDNPLLAPTGVTVGGHPMVYNDAFRAVHDVFGHGLEGANFGARGEENAWRAHRRLFSKEAVPAMTSETRGQNSWVNFGPYGEANRANQRNTVYADQKAGLMPSWTYSETGMPPGYRAGQAALAAAIASMLALPGSKQQER